MVRDARLRRALTMRVLPQKNPHPEERPLGRVSKDGPRKERQPYAITLRRVASGTPLSRVSFLKIYFAFRGIAVDPLYCMLNNT